MLVLKNHNFRYSLKYATGKQIISAYFAPSFVHSLQEEKSLQDIGPKGAELIT